MFQELKPRSKDMGVIVNGDKTKYMKATKHLGVLYDLKIEYIIF